MLDLNEKNSKLHDCSNIFPYTKVIFWNPIKGWHIEQNDMYHLYYCPWCGVKLEEIK